MSKYERTEYIDDRYKAMDERLKVCCLILSGLAASCIVARLDRFGAAACLPYRELAWCQVALSAQAEQYAYHDIRVQVVRKRLNRPLTLAEKVRCTFARPVPCGGLHCRPGSCAVYVHPHDQHDDEVDHALAPSEQDLGTVTSCMVAAG
jgi:hypothetical protein